MGQIQARTCATFAVILAIAGCANDDAKYIHSMPPLSGEVRAHLGAVGLEVVSPANPPNVPGVPLVSAIAVARRPAARLSPACPRRTAPDRGADELRGHHRLPGQDRCRGGKRPEM